VRPVTDVTIRILEKYVKISDPGFWGGQSGRGEANDRTSFVIEISSLVKLGEGKVDNDPKKFADRTDELSRRYGSN
jgi:hypothetical protein